MVTVIASLLSDLSFKHPILFSHRLLVWEIWSHISGEKCQGRRGGRVLGQSQDFELGDAAMASDYFLCPAVVRTAVHMPAL